MCHGHCGKQNKPEAVLAAAWKVWQCFGLQEFQLGMLRSCCQLNWAGFQCTVGSLVLVRCGAGNSCWAEPAPPLSFSLAVPPQRALGQVTIGGLFIQSLPDNMYLSYLVGMQFGNLFLYNKKGVWGSSDLQNVGSV